MGLVVMSKQFHILIYNGLGKHTSFDHFYFILIPNEVIRSYVATSSFYLLCPVPPNPSGLMFLSLPSFHPASIIFTVFTLSLSSLRPAMMGGLACMGWWCSTTAGVSASCRVRYSTRWPGRSVVVPARLKALSCPCGTRRRHRR